MLSISVNKNLNYFTPIMFVPLGVTTTHSKHVVQKQTAILKKPPAKPKAVIKAANIEPKKSTTVAATAKKPTPKTDAKEAPKVTVAPKKIEPVKQEAPKISAVVPEKIVPAKETPKVEPKKPDALIEKVAAIEPSKPTPLEKEIPQPPVAQALDTEQTITPIIPENAHVSHNYREVEALRRGAQLQKELVQRWKPPIGASPDCMCEISFFVNNTGTIENLKVIKSSGVVMYDISARQALFAMKMPQWTHGKPLIISFKQ